MNRNQSLKAPFQPRLVLGPEPANNGDDDKFPGGAATRPKAPVKTQAVAPADMLGRDDWKMAAFRPLPETGINQFQMLDPSQPSLIAAPQPWSPTDVDTNLGICATTFIELGDGTVTNTVKADDTPRSAQIVIFPKAFKIADRSGIGGGMPTILGAGDRIVFRDHPANHVSEARSIAPVGAIVPVEAASGALHDGIYAGADLKNPARAPYWLINKRSVPVIPGQLMFSFSGNDQRWVKPIADRVNPLLFDNGLPSSFIYTKPSAGVPIDREIVPNIVEQIFSASAACVLLSSNYFASDFCRLLELQLIIHRMRNDGLKVYFVHVGEHNYGSMRIPYPIDSEGHFRNFVISTVGDDRKWHPEWCFKRRLRSLEVLESVGVTPAINARMTGLVGQIMKDFGVDLE